MTENKLQEIEIDRECLYIIRSKIEKFERIHLVNKDYNVMNYITIPIGSLFLGGKDKNEYGHIVAIRANCTLMINKDIISIKKIEI